LQHHAFAKYGESPILTHIQSAKYKINNELLGSGIQTSNFKLRDNGNDVIAGKPSSTNTTSKYASCQCKNQSDTEVPNPIPKGKRGFEAT